MNALTKRLLVLLFFTGFAVTGVNAADGLYVEDYYNLDNAAYNFTVNLGNWSQNYTLTARLNVSGSNVNDTIVTWFLPYGFENQTPCNASTGFRSINNSFVACSINISTVYANNTNVTLVATANLSAYSDANTSEFKYFYAEASNSSIGATSNSTPAGHYYATYYVNPRPYAETASPEFSQNATLWITNWNQTQPNYTLYTPIESYNDTLQRPEYRNSSFGELMYLPASMFERPDYMELWSYNLTFSLRDMLSENGMVFRICSAVNTTLTPEQTLIPLLIYNETQWDFFANESFNMTLGTPSQTGFSVWVDGTQYTVANAVGIGLNLTFNAMNQDNCSAGGVLEVNATNATTANNTQISLLFTLSNVSGQGGGSSSPIYVNYQTLGGFDFRSPPRFGENITYDYYGNISNHLNNYTLNDLTIQFFLPENVTPYKSGAQNTTLNISSNMSMYWWDAGWVNTGVNMRTNCMNKTDTMPGSPMEGANISVCFRIYEIQLVSSLFNNWLPNSSNSNITVKMNATMSFPALEEINSTPGTVGSSNYYNATFSSSMKTNLDLTDKVPGIVSAGCSRTTIVMDGQTLTCNTNYSIGSLTLLNVGSGSHSVSVSYSLAAPAASGGSGTTPSTECHTCRENGVCEVNCCNTDPDCGEAAAAPAATTAQPTVLPSPQPTPTEQPAAEEEGEAVPTVQPPTALPLAPPEATYEQASQAIQAVQDLLAEAQQQGVDASEATRLLSLATQARDAGDYRQAMAYSLEAEESLNKVLAAKYEAAGFDWSMLLAVIVVAAIVAAYYYYGRKPGHKRL